VEISTKQLKSELKWVQKFIEKKTTIPVLSCMTVAAKPGSITLIGTDLEISGISRIEAASDEDWTVCVPTQRLLKYLDKVAESTVALAPAVEQLAYNERCNTCQGQGNDRHDKKCPDCTDGYNEKARTQTKLTVTHGEDGEVTIEGMDPEAFPVIPLAPITSYITGLDIAAPRAMVSISNEESRFTLNGALLTMEEGKGKLITTDGHRLGIVDVTVATSDPALKTLILKRALAEAAAMDNGKCYFGMNDTVHIFTNGSRTIVSRKLSGTFPDYQRVIPKTEHRIEFNPKDFDKVLDRVALFTDERSHALKLHVGSGKLTAMAETLDTGKSKGSVSATGVNGSNWECGFNCDYLRDFMKHTKDSVALEFADIPAQEADGPKVYPKAAMLKTEGWTYCIMPMH
jgi:DNA polymerase-3 subunit beta